MPKGSILYRILYVITVLLGAAVVFCSILSTFGVLIGRLAILPFAFAGGVLIMGVLLYLVRQAESPKEATSEERVS